MYWGEKPQMTFYVHVDTKVYFIPIDIPFIPFEGLQICIGNETTQVDTVIYDVDENKLDLRSFINYKNKKDNELKIVYLEQVGFKKIELY